MPCVKNCVAQLRNCVQSYKILSNCIFYLTIFSVFVLISETSPLPFLEDY